MNCIQNFVKVNKEFIMYPNYGENPYDYMSKWFPDCVPLSYNHTKLSDCLI